MSISVSVMPWLLFQSDGHFDTSMVNPFEPTYRFLLFGSWPYLPVPAGGITGLSAAVVVGPPLVDAGAVLAADVGAAAVVAAAVVAAAAAGAAVVAAAPPLLSPPHAAAITPNDTSTVVGASHRCFVTRSPDVRRHAPRMSSGVQLPTYDVDAADGLAAGAVKQRQSQPEQRSQAPFGAGTSPRSGVDAER